VSFETFTAVRTPWDGPTVSEDVTVEYVEVPHWNTHGNEKAYDVLVDGQKVGRVEQVRYMASTNYKGTRIRSDLGYRLEWSWRRMGSLAQNERRENYPGSYERTCRSAAACILGYDFAKGKAA
jgi:hypothetical protein